MQSVLILTLLISVQAAYKPYDDYTVHPCKRNCNQNFHSMECVYNWTIEWYRAMNNECGNCPFDLVDCYKRNCVAINGHERAVITVNRMIPGPSIEVCEGDTIVVNVKNMLRIVEGITLHWHGLLQRKSPHMDGANMITQCPIMHNNYFQYRFLAEDSGTYWWHSHVHQQRSDGAFGALIIRQNGANDPNYGLYDYDLSEHVIIVNDWFNETTLVNSGPHVKDVTMLDADSIIINGKGVSVHFTENNSDTVFVTPKAVFNVNYNEKYRFRLISNAIVSCPIKFIIEDHNITLIAVDGHPIEPIKVRSFVVHSGERYDFVLNANQMPRNYVIKLYGDSMCNMEQTAILHYNNKQSIPMLNIYDSKDDSYTFDEEGIVVNPISMSESLKVKRMPKYIKIDELKSKKTQENTDFLNKIKKRATKTFYLNIEYYKIFNAMYPQEQFTVQWQNISNVLPPIPPLFEWDSIPKNLICNYMNKTHVCPSDSNEICSCIHVLEADLNDVVEFVIADLDESKSEFDETIHMFHLHGHSFAILAAEQLPEGTTFKKLQELDKKGKLKRNFDKPPIKDTTVVPGPGYTIIRFIADNPGTWFAHCHTEFHMVTGLSLLFKVGNTKDLSVKKPNAWPECGTLKYNLQNDLFF